jgi:CheY-like chemotaxis protein
MSNAVRLGLPRVAIVDDEEDVLTYLRLVLEDAGCEVLACAEATSAIEQLAQFAPDLICLDLLMPERTGVSLYLETRRDPRLKAVPVLILSGLHANSELLDLLRDQGKAAPPAGFIEKPVEAARFLAAVRGLLGAARLGVAS